MVDELYIVRGKAVGLANGEPTDEPGRYKVATPLAPSGYATIGKNAFFTRTAAREQAERNARALKQGTA